MKINELRFLTDENIDRELVEFLRVSGFDVFDIIDEKLFRISDADILALSVSQNRVVISQDSDFGTLIFRDQAPVFGIIYLRPGHESPAIHLDSLRAILEADLDFLIPFILVADHSGETIRLRLRGL